MNQLVARRVELLHGLMLAASGEVRVFRPGEGCRGCVQLAHGLCFWRDDGRIWQEHAKLYTAGHRIAQLSTAVNGTVIDEAHLARCAASVAARNAVRGRLARLDLPEKG